MREVIPFPQRGSGMELLGEGLELPAHLTRVAVMDNLARIGCLLGDLIRVRALDTEE